MGRSSPSAKSSYGHFYLFVRIKKERGRGSERPTGVRVVRDSEAVRSLGPELELEAPAGLGVHFHEESILRRSSKGHEPFGENGRERPVCQVRARRVRGADHSVAPREWAGSRCWTSSRQRGTRLPGPRNPGSRRPSG